MKPNETFSVFQNDEEALNAAIELDYKNLLKESDNMEKPALKQTSNSRTTDAQRGNSLHCTAENSIPIPNF